MVALDGCGLEVVNLVIHPNTRVAFWICTHMEMTIKQAFKWHSCEFVVVTQQHVITEHEHLGEF